MDLNSGAEAVEGKKRCISNLSCELVDEMRMVEEVVMMEREVVVGGLQSPGLR